MSGRAGYQAQDVSHRQGPARSKGQLRPQAPPCAPAASTARSSPGFEALVDPLDGLAQALSMVT
jgi:hypothetical protein